MALQNIDYNLGQDNMQGVFDKTNLAIDLVNAIDNWQIADKNAIFANLDDSNAGKIAYIDRATALYNNKLVLLSVTFAYGGLAETGAGTNGAIFNFNPAFMPVGNLTEQRAWEIFNETLFVSSGSVNGFTEIQYNISNTSPLGSSANPFLWFYGGGIGYPTCSFYVTKNFAYKLS